MKKKLSICVLLGILMATPLAIFAQDDTSTEPAAPTFSFSGSVDTYFHTAIGTEEDAPSTAFDNHKGFALGMANLVASYDGAKAGFKADLVFGQRGTDAVFNSTGSSSIVNQLYAYWKPVDALTLTLGNFNTYIGYEVISPTVNVNYSTSYMFSYGPFSHTGLKANVDLGSGLNIMAAVMNPTDWTDYQPVDTYTFGGQLGYTNDSGGAWLNFLAGDQTGTGDDIKGTFQVDLTTGWTLNDMFYLGLNTTYNSTKVTGISTPSFMGVAVYPKLTFSESSILGLRAEYFSYKNGYLINGSGVGVVGYDANGDGSVVDLTLSLNEKVGNLTLIPEFRVDMAKENSWHKKDTDVATSFDTKTMPTFSLAAVYSF